MKKYHNTADSIMFVTHSGEDTREVGAKLAGMLSRGDTVLLYGGLGAGKTTLIQGIAGALGFKYATSPTFAILHPYECSLDGKPVTLFHFDCYRLSDADELFDAGLYEYIDDPRNIALIEWPENITGALPDKYIAVKIIDTGPQSREISITYNTKEP